MGTTLENPQGNAGEAATSKSYTPKYAAAEVKPTTPASESKDETKTATTLPLQRLFMDPAGLFGDAAPAFDPDAAKQELDPDSKPGESRKGDGLNERLNTYDVGNIPIFFVLNNRPGVADKLAPVALHDPDKTTPLQITDNGRVLATATDSKTGKADWSISNNQQTGEIETITYPDGKVRQFKHEGGQLTRVETVEKGADGQMTRTIFQRDPETKRWQAVVGGIKADLPGEVQLTKDGVVSFQMDNQGKWRSERPDGTILIERTIQSGARVAFNDDNSVQQITRPDQSRVECVRDKGELVQVNEIGADGKAVSWTKNGEKWVSNTTPPQERTKLEVSENGNLSYISTDNIKHTITGGGLDLQANPNGSEFAFDQEGRFTDLKDVNGLRVKGITYHPETGQVTRAQVGSVDGGRLYTYEREGTTNQWRYTVSDANGNVLMQDRWTGDIAIGKDGTYAYKEDPRHGRNADNLWSVFKLDGTQYLMQDDGQGGRAFFDMNKNLLAVERANGTRLDVNRQNGIATTMTETLRNGEQIKYTLDGTQGVWVPDNPNVRPIKKFDAAGSGMIQTIDINGSISQTSLDGSTIVKNADGSISECDNLGRVLKTTSKGGDVVRTFNWEGEKLVSVMENRKGGESRTIAGKDMAVRTDGTIKYTDVDGQKLSTTADGSWQAWQNFNGKDLIVKAVNPKGYMRTIIRDESGEATSMIDQRPPVVDDKGQQTQPPPEEYRRVMDNGRWTDSWGKVGPDGKVTARHNVQILDNGTYNYIDSTGKDKVARVGDRGWESGFSDSVEEARSRLTEMMESHLDEAQKKRFQIILDRFEKRAKERVEAQTAGGLDVNKSTEDWDQKLAKTYDHLANMLKPDAPGATYDLKTRAKLVENAAFAMAFPVKADDQGGWGCCWMISGVYCGVIQYPDKMAHMLSQLSMEGKYTDINGKTWSPPKRLLTFTGEGNRWTIENCGRGQRSPVSEIWTSVAAYLSNDGRRMDRGAGGGTESACNHAMKLITGDTWKVTGERSMTSSRMKDELLRKGAYICLMPGHMYLGALEKHGEEWQLVASMQHGDGGRRVNGYVTDLANWKVNGGRRKYSIDTSVPGCNDKPIGPGRGPNAVNDWDDGGDGGGRRWWRPRIWRLFRGGCDGCCSSAVDETLMDKYRKQQLIEDQERAVALREKLDDIQDDFESDQLEGKKRRAKRKIS